MYSHPGLNNNEEDKVLIRKLWLEAYQLGYECKHTNTEKRSQIPVKTINKLRHVWGVNDHKQKQCFVFHARKAICVCKPIVHRGIFLFASVRKLLSCPERFQFRFVNQSRSSCFGLLCGTVFTSGGFV